MENTNVPHTPTQAQVDANRLNAQKSTGPRSASGKAASSRNRLIHGLRSTKHILADENPEDFLLLLKDLYECFEPVGDAQQMLVLRIANDQWRLDRAIPLEAAIYRNRMQEIAAEHREAKRSTSKRSKPLRKEAGRRLNHPLPPTKTTASAMPSMPTAWRPTPSPN